MCSLKNLTFRSGELMKSWYRGVDCLKNGAWTVCRFKGGGWGGGGAWEERGGSVFEDVVYITAVKEK